MALEADDARLRGNVDDLSRLPLDHAGHDLARQQEGRAQIHRHGGVPVGNLGILQPVDEGNAGVVHQDVDVAEIGQRIMCRLYRTIGARHIGRDRHAAPADCLNSGLHLGQALAVAAHGGDVGARIGQHFASFDANALARPRHQRVLALEAKSFRPVTHCLTSGFWRSSCGERHRSMASTGNRTCREWDASSS